MKTNNDTGRHVYWNPYFGGFLLGLISDSFITNYPMPLGAAFSWIFISAAVALVLLLIVKQITSS